MILAVRGQNREVRMADWGTSFIPPWSQFSGAAGTGVPVNLDTASAVPAVLASIRLISETIGALSCRVYSGRGAERKQEDASWQWQLLCDSPDGGETSACQFFQGVSAFIEASGEFFAQKIKSRGKVVKFRPIKPSEVSDVKRDEQTGEKRYTINRENFSSADILHIPGFLLNGGERGLSPIRLARMKLSSKISQDRFENDYYGNGAGPGIVLKFPETLKQAQAKEWVDYYDANHAGVENQHKTFAIGGGADVVQVPYSLGDAQFVETMKWSSEEVAKLFLGPSWSILYGGRQKNEEESLRFFNFALLPRLKRIESALRIDDDLFGTGRLYPEFDTNEFLRADAATTAQVRHLQIQDGTLLVDEARAEDGRPPLPDGLGKIPQIVPVGGSPIGVPATNGATADATANGSSN